MKLHPVLGLLAGNFVVIALFVYGGVVMPSLVGMIVEQGDFATLLRVGIVLAMIASVLVVFPTIFLLRRKKKTDLTSHCDGAGFLIIACSIGWVLTRAGINFTFDNIEDAFIQAIVYFAVPAFLILNIYWFSSVRVGAWTKRQMAAFIICFVAWCLICHAHGALFKTLTYTPPV